MNEKIFSRLELILIKVIKTEVYIQEMMLGSSQRAIEKQKKVSLNFLKLIAIIAMVVDHTAYTFVYEGSNCYILMRFIGRITAPIMFYAAVEGYHHTKDVRKYLYRLAVFAGISYLPFLLFINDVAALEDIEWLHQSVIYTIFLGVLAIHIRHQMKNSFLKWILIILLGLLSVIGDWGETGFLIMLVFDFYYGNFAYQSFGYILILLLKVGLLMNLIDHIITWIYWKEWSFNVEDFKQYWLSQYGMILPILLLSLYSGEKGRGGSFSKYFFYVFYPLHLLVIWIISRFLI